MSPSLGYTIAEACMRAPLCRTKLYQAINAGQLAARKIGRKTVILHDDLVRYLEALPAIKPKQCDPPDGAGEKPRAHKRAVS